jgi:cytochrome c553
MKVVCILTAVALLILAPVLLWSEETGAGVYDSNCSMCHGAKGEGNTDIPAPAVAGTAMTAEQMVVYLTKGDKTKTIHADPVAGLNEEQAKAVAAHVKTLKK